MKTQTQPAVNMQEAIIRLPHNLVCKRCGGAFNLDAIEHGADFSDDLCSVECLNAENTALSAIEDHALAAAEGAGKGE